ncbi:MULTISPECIES: imidazole glycerol phosphate synthase subunit HisF [Hymenobacter]|uniref:Imidazole glycerol phosphate synthase subunit HisF n=1 Tax=Hymenobacter canadensis TaxID=2999067 RepID=A0ABY7LVW7_9BACT|nr:MULTISPECIES: imidazole glycerol phosphate synthase subunit HisF [Hymenobacter]MBC6698811.1 imidazole glycerol phosphate synthase subunit HisF [Hymenobacter sp. BT190]WBA43058.1 imidazole glycerol phosphate synthase subunit HisF [Hymenobacter canadensis]
MLTKRIIPCLDVKDGRTVKGVRFEGLRDAGDPVALAARYAREGADELVFLDITATNQKRATLVALVRDVARELDIPFTVGGGIGTVSDVEALLMNGADKVSINSAALARPELIDELAARFGSQCIVVAADARYNDADGWQIYTRAGTHNTGRDAVQWCREAAERGAGEILLTSMSNDGTKDGFALDITGAVSRAVTIPVIASGGAGSKQDFTNVFQQAHADAGLAASIFHFGEIGIRELKEHLRQDGIAVRL